MDNNPGFFTLQQNQNHKNIGLAERETKAGVPKHEKKHKKTEDNGDYGQKRKVVACPRSEEFDQDWDQTKKEKIVRYIPPRGKETTYDFGSRRRRE